jgi:hypothetical protein
MTVLRRGAWRVARGAWRVARGAWRKAYPGISTPINIETRVDPHAPRTIAVLSVSRVGARFAIDDSMCSENILHEMESKYRCRYERGGQGSGLRAFPVTHVLEAGRVCADSGRLMRYAHVSVSNGELLNWCIMDDAGCRLLHGCERNIGGTRAGYVAMIRRVLRRLQPYGARRVYPRDLANRRGPARTASQWSLHGWPR